jgi:SCP-2 sterol transfer family
MVHSWVDNTRMLLHFEQENRARCFRLTYESYVLHPEAVLPPMFAFLGVPWDPSLLDAVFSTQHDPGGGDSKIRFAQRIHHDSIGKGSTLNRQLIPERLLEEMNAVLTELSYPIVGPDWDTTPSPYRTMMAPSMTADPVTPEISEIFSRYLTQRISVAQVGFDGRQVTYKVVVTGDAGGVWMITPTASETQVRAGEEPADCTFTLAGPDLLALINGTLNPAEAWMQGKLHIAGDLAQAEAFGRILFSGRHNTPGIELQQV